jgi:hypothetical protein
MSRRVRAHLLAALAGWYISQGVRAFLDAVELIVADDTEPRPATIVKPSPDAGAEPSPVDEQPP